ncbi:hypothetical protein ACE14D_09650 [Streptomyces sp. Act-28]
MGPASPSTSPPVLLPPTLARPIERQLTTGRARAVLGPLVTSEHPELLLPGHPTNRPRGPETLSGQLVKHGPPAVAARGTASSGTVGESPPIIISDLFGVHRNAATRWAAPARESRAGHLAALRPAEWALRTESRRRAPTLT